MFKLLIYYQFINIVYCIQINYIKVPQAVKNDTQKPTILDCVYSIRPDDTDLVVKWYLNEQVVYQWIPPQKPQALNQLKNRLDLKHRATDDPKSVHRALKIINPTNDIAGSYKCFVSTFADEDFSMKTMIVFEPERFITIEQSKTSDSNNKTMNFTCFASEVYPAPKLILYKENKDDFHTKSRLHIIQWDTNRHANGRFSVFVVATVPIEILSPGTLIYCELRIPGTGYVKMKNLLYFPQEDDESKSANLLSGKTSKLVVMVIIYNLLY